MDQLSTWKDIAIVFGGIVALITLVTGMVELFRQGNQHRVTRFMEMRRRFLESELFRDISNLLATDSPDLRNVPLQDRRNYAGFLEEVALMVNSRVISKSVAYYMFGDYVLLTDRSNNFWYGLDRNSVYWSVFRGFVKTMEAVERDGKALTKTPKF